MVILKYSVMNMGKLKYHSVGQFLYICVSLVTVDSICVFGDGCLLPCKCATNTCDPATGHCAPGDHCQLDPVLTKHKPDNHSTYWGGGACQTGNIAKGMHAQQPGALNDEMGHTASAECALDGNLDTYSYSNEHNPGHEEITWWRVDLKTLNNIEKVFIITHNLGNKRIKLENYTVWVGNQSDVFTHKLCGYAPSPLRKTFKSRKLWKWNEVKCKGETIGRYVSIRKSESDSVKDLLPLHEVAVIGYPTSSIKLGYCLKYVEPNGTATLLNLSCEICIPGWFPPDCKTSNITTTTILPTSKAKHQNLKYQTTPSIINKELPIIINSNLSRPNITNINKDPKQDQLISKKMNKSLKWYIIIISLSVFIITTTVFTINFCFKSNEQSKLKSVTLCPILSWLKSSDKNNLQGDGHDTLQGNIPFLRVKKIPIFIPPNVCWTELMYHEVSLSNCNNVQHSSTNFYEDIAPDKEGRLKRTQNIGKQKLYTPHSNIINRKTTCAGDNEKSTDTAESELTIVNIRGWETENRKQSDASNERDVYVPNSKINSNINATYSNNKNDINLPYSKIKSDINVINSNIKSDLNVTKLNINMYSDNNMTYSNSESDHDANINNGTELTTSTHNDSTLIDSCIKKDTCSHFNSHECCSRQVTDSANSDKSCNDYIINDKWLNNGIVLGNNAATGAYVTAPASFNIENGVSQYLLDSNDISYIGNH